MSQKLVQKLTIQNFGPISDVSLDVKDILVFIGSQASGKSTVSKAIFFFKSLRDDLISYLYQCYNQNQFDNSISTFSKRAKQKFLKIYGSVLHFSEMRLCYQYGNDVSITVNPSANKQYTDIFFSQPFVRKYRDLVEAMERMYIDLQEKPLFLSSQEISNRKAQEADLFEHIAKEVNELFGDERDILFIPAGRSLITTLSKQRYNIEMDKDWTSNYGDPEVAVSQIKLDYLMQSFIDRVDGVKPIFNQNFNRLIKEKLSSYRKPENKRVIQLVTSLIDSILKGSYRYQNGTESINFGNQSILINFASSGQQEVVWILLFILLFILNERRVFLVIEEPEAHLFPVAQKQIVDLIALLVNQNSNQVLITTHSPYILSSLNNLLYAHNLGEMKEQETSRVVNRDFWIDPDRLDAYILEEGKLRSIFEPETNLIESAEIDRASDVIVSIFNELFELEAEA